MDRSSAEGTLVEAPKTPRGMKCPPEEGSGEGARPTAQKILLFDLKMEHFGAVFKLDVPEETRIQL